MPFLSCHFPRNTTYSVLILYARGRQIAARGSNVARHSVFSGPWNHSGNMFKSEIFFNLPQSMLLLTTEANLTNTCFYFH